MTFETRLQALLNMEKCVLALERILDEDRIPIQMQFMFGYAVKLARDCGIPNPIIEQYQRMYKKVIEKW